MNAAPRLETPRPGDQLAAGSSTRSNSGASLTSSFASPRARLPRHERSGGVLVLALVCVVAVAGLAAAFLQLSTSVTRRQVQMRDRMRAFYVAEAGLSEAWAGIQVRKTGAIGSEEDPAKFGDGLFWVEATDEGNFIRLESTALVDRGRAALGLVVLKGDSSVASLGVHSNGDLELPPGTFLDAYDSRLGYKADGAVDGYTEEELDQLLLDFAQQVGGAEGGAGAELGGSALLGPLEPPQSEPVEETGGGEPQTAAGRIGSGGNISVSGTEEEPTVIAGDLVPGTQGVVTTEGAVEISGSTTAAPAPVTFPEVEVPSLPEIESVRHAGSDPLLILPVEASLPQLALAENAEVVIEGPAKLVVGELFMASGASLHFDTRGGEVEIFVTGSANMSPGAKLSNSTHDPTQLSLQIATEPVDPVTIPSGTPFYGMIYAPHAQLSIPPGFELFGSLVADQIAFGGPPRLHFDQYIDDWVNDRSKPRLLSWRILELANENGAVASPFVRLGLDPSLLRSPSLAHASQPISVRYKNGSGVDSSYTGAEDLFDWTDVTEVQDLERDGEAVVADGKVRASSDQAQSLKAGTSDALAGYVKSFSGTDDDLITLLLNASPLSKETLSAAIGRDPAMPSANLRSLALANHPVDPENLRALTNNLAITAAHLSDVLIAHSPGLDRSTLADAQAVLPPADFANVLAAQ